MFTTSLRKLLHLSFDEIVFRLQAEARRRYEEWCYDAGLGRDPETRLMSNRQGEIVFASPWVASAAQEVLVKQLQEEHPDYIQAVQDRADALCNFQFAFFGQSIRYDAHIDWCADPLSRAEWPMQFHTRMEIFQGDTGNGDVKYVWELNRHQFLPTLGKAYRLTGNERYATAGLALMLDWIRANPYKVGINWTSALEVAIRCLSWCWACALFEGSQALTPEIRQLIIRSLYQHGRYIGEHLSFFFSPYNHLIGEVAALYMLGSLLPELHPARRWRDKGWAILVQEMPKQFHPDGGTVEQATGYHHFTLGFYLQALLMRRRLSLPVPSHIWALLEKTFEFSMYMMRPDGCLPMVGDVDDGRSLDLFQPSLWDFRGYLALGAVLHRRGDFKQMAGAFPVDAIWLVGSEGWSVYETLEEKAPAAASTALSASGYYTMRTGWDAQAHYLNFDCGEIADGVPQEDIGSAAHGHADVLSIEVASHGTPMLVDPGLYTYNGDIDWHRYFRETAAHNTLVVDDTSQAEYRGRLKWSCAPQAQLHSWVRSLPFDYVEGSHNGYQRLPQPVTHRRAIVFFKPHYWLVRDEVIGEGVHQLDRYFHFAPLLVTCQPALGLFQACATTGANLCVMTLETSGVTALVMAEGHQPADGWLATGYGSIVRAPVGRYRAQVQLPVAQHTLLIPFRGSLPNITVKRLSTDSTTQAHMTQGFSLTIGRHHDIVLCASPRGLTRFEGGWMTDSHMASVRLDEHGSIESCALIDGSILVRGSQELFRMDKQVHWAVLYRANNGYIIELSEPAHLVTSVSNPHIQISSTRGEMVHA
jgi:hypothetical protein